MCYNAPMEEPKAIIRWHEIFGELLSEVVSPTHISVQTNVLVSTTPPQIDIILMQNVSDTSTWTTEQLQYLPDGIRESTAQYILIEFKYTECVTHRALHALMGYQEFFLRANHLAEKRVQSFLVSAHQPHKRRRHLLGYTEEISPGGLW
jgi:hypothetical protein